MPQDTTYLWTSECVGAGHPDKVADQISDAILDACLEQDPLSRVACETLVKSDRVILAGEITTKAEVNHEQVVKATLEDIGYWYEPKVTNLLTTQSPEIAKAVGDESEGAGDQGIMFGYACSDTPNKMPLTLFLSRWLVSCLEQDKSGLFLPDCKTQVTVKYKQDKPLVVERVVISVNHKSHLSLEDLRQYVSWVVSKKLFELPDNLQNLFDHRTFWDINPAGLWLLGGPEADCGLTGRKIIVDGYGADCPWGGGALSGKDAATKVDRGASYMARYIAKNIVHRYGYPKVQVQLSYAIGRPEPTSFRINSGMGDKEDRALEKDAQTRVCLQPRGITKHLKLRQPIYRVTAKNGHFGVDPCTQDGKSFYTWEQTDLFNLP